MRKVLSFVLVLAMILGSVSMAFAFSDTEGVANETAINAIAELGLISGYADGTFGADKTITRAEFVTMVVNALGFTTTGSANTGFKDVANDYWAAQAILTAKNLGIVYGKTTTTFAPKDPVTYDEAIAFMMRALGYQSQYLLGSYPANYINQAKTLDVLNKVKTGSANATRGEVAQLIYNCLNEEVVTYNYFGVAVGTATLLERLGQQLYVGTPYGNYVTGGAFVLTDKESYASGVNLMGRYGEYVTAFANSKNKITGIKTVESTTLTGKFNSVNAPTKFTLSDGTAYDLKNITSEGAFVYLENGLWNSNSKKINQLVTDTAYTIAADVDGKIIDDIYSVSKWAATSERQFTKGAYSAKALTFCGYKFQALANDPKAIDPNAFALLGAASLDDIKEDDVVTIYTGGSPAHITRIEVSSKVVEGKVTRVSGGKYTVDGTAYQLSSNPGANASIEIKSEGSFYLNYAGKIAFFAGTSKATYAVVTKISNGSGTGLNAVSPKAELVLSDGTPAVYEIIPASGNTTFTKYTTAGAVTTMAALNTTDLTTVENELKGKLVEFTLTTAGKLATVTVVGTTTSATKVEKSGTIGGKYIDENAVVFVYNGSDVQKASNYSLVQKAGLLGSDFTAAGSVVYIKDGVIKAALLNGASAKASTYVVLVDLAQDAETNYKNAANVLEGGEAKTYYFDTVDAFAAVTKAAIYKIALDANGALTNSTEILDVANTTRVALVAVTANSASATAIKTTGTSDTLKVTDTSGAEHYFALDASVLVYAWDETDEEWTFDESGVEGLNAKYDGYYIVLFDTTSTPDGVYDIVMITKVPQQVLLP